MPARNPDIHKRTEDALAGIGRALRARRLDLGVSAVNTAEAAGMSRVTLHRVEAGSPAVTIGAYMNAAAALGLQLALETPQHPHTPEPETAPTQPAPETKVRIGDYPQLRAIAWHLRRDTELDEGEALQLYERNWRHVDQRAMGDDERAFVRHLADTYSRGVLLV